VNRSGGAFGPRREGKTCSRLVATGMLERSGKKGNWEAALKLSEPCGDIVSGGAWPSPRAQQKTYQNKISSGRAAKRQRRFGELLRGERGGETTLPSSSAQEEQVPAKRSTSLKNYSFPSLLVGEGVKLAGLFPILNR